MLSKRSLKIALVFIVFAFSPFVAKAASLSVEPKEKTFTVGGTFEVSIYLDTEGQSVNALDIILNFPVDKLQVTSPSTGNSVIGVWTSQPKFDNQNGTIRLQGGIPGGIKVSKGLVATLTFRGRGVGSAVVKFAPGSKVLANDGKGTDLLKQTSNGVYNLILPPPEGPNVSSKTHPNPEIWYTNTSPVIEWELDPTVESYSYVLNDSPVDTPDDIPDGTVSSLSYPNLSDGRYYFHIKALRKGIWGGVTHFSFKIDSTSPAQFPIEIIPSSWTSRRRPVIQFTTTDKLSAINRYELKMIPLQQGVDFNPLFFEVQSPYIPEELNIGSYDVIVRAYDEAENYTESTQKLKIVSPAFSFVTNKGIQINDEPLLSWKIVWTILLILIVLLSGGAYLSRKRHAKFHSDNLPNQIPGDLKKQLEELKIYRNKYGKLAIILLFLISIPFSAVMAQEKLDLSPPVISTISKEISNEEIFYVGGSAEHSNPIILIYLQNKDTLQTQNFSVTGDKQGNWFYRHSGFLVPGNYIIWAQEKNGDAISAPSPQVMVEVSRTALQLGSSKFSMETIYLLFLLLAGLIIASLATFITYHLRQGNKKKQLMNKEIREAEEALRKGFAVLKRDIEAELSLIHKAKLSRALANEERTKEEQLLKDLEVAQRYVGKEIWDIHQSWG